MSDQPTTTTPAPQAPAQITRIRVMGPQGSGKTTLLGAITQAVTSAADTSDAVRLAPADELANALHLRHLALLEEGGTHLPDSMVREFQFTWVDASRGRGPEAEHRVVFADLPGSWFFPPCRTTGLPRLHQVDPEGSEAVVLCVDGSDPAQVQALHRYLPLVLRDVGVSAVPGAPDSRRTVSGAGQTARARPRVLLLWTKIDRVAAQYAAALGRRFAGSPGHTRAPRPDDLARRIDCAELFARRFGETVPNLLRLTLPRGTDLAYAVCSATGFHARTGLPMLRAGRPHALPCEAGHRDLLSSWRPFGVREALRYLVTGNRPAGVHRFGDAAPNKARKWTLALPRVRGRRGGTR